METIALPIMNIVNSERNLTQYPGFNYAECVCIIGQSLQARLNMNVYVV